MNSPFIKKIHDNHMRMISGALIPKIASGGVSHDSSSLVEEYNIEMEMEYLSSNESMEENIGPRIDAITVSKIAREFKVSNRENKFKRSTFL